MSSSSSSRPPSVLPSLHQTRSCNIIIQWQQSVQQQSSDRRAYNRSLQARHLAVDREMKRQKEGEKIPSKSRCGVKAKKLTYWIGSWLISDCWLQFHKMFISPSAAVKWSAHMDDPQIPNTGHHSRRQQAKLF